MPWFLNSEPKRSAIIIKNPKAYQKYSKRPNQYRSFLLAPGAGVWLKLICKV